MGALHQGHATLIRAAKQQGGRVLVSVFVNPLQFGPNEDFARYPRCLEEDHVLALAAGADALWAPQLEDVFPAGAAGLTQLAPAPELVANLCGPARPGHFEGVCTVVSRLLALVQPTHLHLGEKDWQQLQVLRRLVGDLNWPVQIAVPTLRERDGLPLSSRNAYLSAEQRQQAAVLAAALALGQELLDAGQRQAEPLLQAVRALMEDGGLAVDYLQLVDLPGCKCWSSSQDLRCWRLLSAAARPA